MPCSHVRIPRPDGTAVHAIICGRTRIKTCCKCGAISTRECDWKIGGGKTCDRPICEACTHSPAPEKDLCPQHAAEWRARQPVPITTESQ